ncbi:hypothetical protein D3C81_1845910 [compost metagenome]
MLDRFAATWASFARSTIKVSAKAKVPPCPKPSTTAHPHSPESGAYRQPNRPARVISMTSTIARRWSLPRVASQGALSELTSCTITDPDSTNPASVGLRPRPIRIDGNQPKTM